jgi:hypothetical protein
MSYHRKTNWLKSKPFVQKAGENREEQPLNLVDRAGFEPGLSKAILVVQGEDTVSSLIISGLTPVHRLRASPPNRDDGY